MAVASSIRHLGSEAQRRRYLPRLIDGSLEKTYAFKNFHETMGFVNAVAFIANAEDHHPDLALSYGKCTVRFNTHDVNGISASDFFCASKVDALLA